MMNVSLGTESQAEDPLGLLLSGSLVSYRITLPRSTNKISRTIHFEFIKNLFYPLFTHLSFLLSFVPPFLSKYLDCQNVKIYREFFMRRRDIVKLRCKVLHITLKHIHIHTQMRFLYMSYIFYNIIYYITYFSKKFSQYTTNWKYRISPLRLRLWEDDL